MPHGVLFRGGAEKQIRAGFIKDDLLEAVIGLAPNLFYGTGIPACILVLRAKGAKPPERRGKVLFINADAEYRAGRAQSYLDPEHIQKIVEAYRRFEDIHAFATVVTREDLVANEFNLNIRRYADNAPPPEPQDVRAHLLGGVPKAEVEAKRDLFEAHGLDPMTLFVERDEKYLDFAPEIASKADLQSVIETDAGVMGREAELTAALDAWWSEHHERIVRLPETRDMMRVRAEFLDSFEEALVPVGLLDRFKVAGAVASWWGEVQFDLKSVVARGFDGTVDGWVATVTTAIEDDGGRFDPLDHKLVRHLLPEFLSEIADAEAEVARLDAMLKAGQVTEDEDDEGVEDAVEALSEQEMKTLRRELAQAKRVLKKLRADVAARLVRARETTTAEADQGLVLDLLRSRLVSTLGAAVAAHRQTIVACAENWWRRYRVTLGETEAERDSARLRLKESLQVLGYVG
jgi:type I restriction enzyme M protein